MFWLLLETPKICYINAVAPSSFPSHTSVGAAIPLLRENILKDSNKKQRETEVPFVLSKATEISSKKEAVSVQRVIQHLLIIATLHSLGNCHCGFYWLTPHSPLNLETVLLSLTQGTWFEGELGMWSWTRAPC